MSDAPANGQKHTGPKPKLSLLSSKQSGIWLNSEEHPIEQPGRANNQFFDTKTSDCADSAKAGTMVMAANATKINVEANHQSSDLTGGKELPQRRNGNAQRVDDQNKMSITKEDLIRLLSMLKSELQSKEIALAAIKCEQLKRLINPVEINRSALASTYVQLQDRFKARDRNNNSNKKKEKSDDSSSASQNPRLGHQGSQQLSNEPKSVDHISDQYDDVEDRENLNMVNSLLELLDRHPLLALPRDSIYCLDYNCNELSTKHYLNLKIQHLDNLINQHRRFRFYMNERLKRSEQRLLEITKELELERSIKREQERSVYKLDGRAVLLKHIDQLKECVEKEKAVKQAMVMTLLSDLLDEKEENEKLRQKITEATSGENVGQPEKLLKIETELDNLYMQLRKQSASFAKSKNDMQSRIHDLEAENASLKAKLDQQSRQQGPMLKSNSDAKDPATLGGTSRPKQPPSPSINNTKQTQVTSLARNVMMNSSGSSSGSISSSTISNTRLPLQAMIAGTSKTQSSHNTHTPSKAPQGSNSSVIGQPSTSGTHKQTSTPQRPSGPSIVPRLAGGSSGEQTPIRVQPLFKSASVLSTNQQVRNLKGSPSAGGAVISPSPSLTRAASTNQSVTKPQVPAKPAQLLDQQQKSLS